MPKLDVRRLSGARHWISHDSMRGRIEGGQDVNLVCCGYENLCGGGGPEEGQNRAREVRWKFHGMESLQRLGGSNDDGR